MQVRTIFAGLFLVYVSIISSSAHGSCCFQADFSNGDIVALRPDLYRPVFRAGDDSTRGWEFSVFADNIFVTKLGLFDAEEPGLDVSHDVGIWDIHGELIVSATVPSGESASLEEGHRFVSVEPTRLPRGVYKVGAHYPSGSNDKYMTLLDDVLTTNLVFYHADALSTEGFQFPEQRGENARNDDAGGYVGANFQFIFEPWDINGDGDIDVSDLDLLVSEIVNSDSRVEAFDLNLNGTIDTADLTLWLDRAAERNGYDEPYLKGDANLDGIVDAADLHRVAINWRGDIASWSAGDFSLDGKVNSNDLNLIALNWQKESRRIGAEQPMHSVPEPGCGNVALLCLACVALIGRGGRQA